jgi:ABC-2 type transport system ATP-binding protein
MLQFTEAEKSYGSKKVLEIASLEMPWGMYWLQGPNGSGKTTLLRMLAGILPSRGYIRLQGLSLKDHPVAYRRLIGWAEAEPLYPDFLTGADLLAFYSDIIQPPVGQVDDLIARLGVASWLDSKAASWSAGMSKKISLLLAFIGRPALIMLDEPLVTLDQPGIAALCDLIDERRSTQESTGFILSSHQPLSHAVFQGIQIVKISDGLISLI